MEEKVSGMKITFGKYKGAEIDALPSSYLRWLSLNCDWDDKVCEEADEEWQFRERYNQHKEYEV